MYQGSNKNKKSNISLQFNLYKLIYSFIMSDANLCTKFNIFTSIELEILVPGIKIKAEIPDILHNFKKI